MMKTGDMTTSRVGEHERVTKVSKLFRTYIHSYRILLVRIYLRAENPLY